MNKTAIIKVVGTACNLRCDYCFFFGNNQGNVISFELLEDFFQQYFGLFSGEINFIWHGGEPLLAGISFYQTVIDLQNRYRKDQDIIRNCIQTNATLINSDWCDFLKQNKFAVGVSLDGDKETHNLHRKFINGLGSFDATMTGIKMLQDYKINFGIIATVTKSGLTKLKDNLDFFVRVVKLKRLAFNLFVDGSNGNKQLVGESITPFDAEFIYQTILQFWLVENNSELSIREIDNCIAGLLGKTPQNCSFNGTCSDYFSLNIDGKIYPCERLSFDGSNMLGNLKSQKLSEIFKGGEFNKHCSNIEQSTDICKSCQYMKFCNNGCTALRGKDNIFSHCLSRKAMYEKLSHLIPVS